MSEYILLTSGFIIPTNRWFSPIEKDTSYLAQLLSREGSTSQDNHLTSLIDSKAIYSSKECNEIFLAYQHKPSFEGYMKMVDILTEIFSAVDLIKFFDIQTRNLFLSPLGYNLLTDVITTKFQTTYKQFAMAPSFFRTIKETSFEDMEGRRKIANELKKRHYYPSVDRNPTLNRLNDLSADRNVFAIFFKYLLTDSNRGNVYA